MKHILNIAIPNGLENGVFQLVKVALSSIVALFGTYQIAANGVAQSIWSLAALAGVSMGPVFITVIGQCMGNGDTKAADNYFRKLTRITLLISSAWNLLIFLLTPAYFAVNSQENEPNEAYVFVICSMPEEKKYALFRFENISIDDTQINIQAHMHNLWGDFEETLASLIENQIGNPQRTNNPMNAAALEATLDYYMYLAKALMPSIVDTWKKPDKDDAYLRRYIKSHTCPVCGWPYTEKEKKCTNCGFDEIQRVFINIEEGQYWKTNTVPQYQNDFFHSHFEVSGGTVRKKTSDTEFYSIVIPEDVTCLGAKSFSGISNLRRIVCPDTLQEIGEDAFDSTYNLKYIILALLHGYHTNRELQMRSRRWACPS
ncbi:MAG: MATE family efflux transporter [Faecousia sp.]